MNEQQMNNMKQPVQGQPQSNQPRPQQPKQSPPAVPAHKPSESGRGMSFTQQAMIGAVVVIVAVGVFFLLKPNASVAPENENTEGQALAVVSAFAPVTSGTDTYTLEKVNWVFEEQSADESGAPTNRARLQLVNLKRADTPIEVGLYRLGTYRGTCAATTLPAGDDLSLGGNLLGSAQCTWADASRQLVAVQDGANVVIKLRSVTPTDTVPAAFVPILTIDVSKIVQK